jgi:multicomponent Na+:H+ antiporter subunit E
LSSPTCSEVRRRAPRLLAVYALLWWVLTYDGPAPWTVGVPTVIAATAVGLMLPAPSYRISLRGGLGFGLLFLRESVRGGIDVSGRVLRANMPLDPALLRYPLTLPMQGPSRVFFANTLSLLPGTLSAAIDGDVLVVHALEGGASTGQDLARLEATVAALFALPDARQA